MSLPIILTLALLGGSEEPTEKLAEAIFEFSQSHIAKALKLLDEAESKTSDPVMLAKIFRQRGIIFEVQQNRLEAIVAFMRAAYYDPSITLSEREHRGQVRALFDCARRLSERGEKESSVRRRHADAFASSEWTCPADPPKVEEPPPPKETSEAVVAVPPPVVVPEPDRGIGWPFWVSAAGAVAAAGTGGGLGAVALARANDGDPASDPRGLATGATVSFAVAGAAAGAAITFLLVELLGSEGEGDQ